MRTLARFTILLVGAFLLMTSHASAQACQQLVPGALARCPLCDESVRVQICSNGVEELCCDNSGEQVPCSEGCGSVFQATVSAGCDRHH